MDLLVTDPPYGVKYVGKTEDQLTIENDGMDDKTFIEFLAQAISAANEVLKPGGAFYVWYASSRENCFSTAIKRGGWDCRQQLIWVKNSLVLGRQDYQWKHEPCLYGWKPGGAHYWGNDRTQTTVLEFDRPTRSSEHPTMKPVALFDYLIKNSSKSGAAVLDLFSGSGTTIIACEQNGRVGYGMELDPRFCDAIINRWEALTGGKAELLSEN